LHTPPQFPAIGGIYVGPPLWMIVLLEDEKTTKKVHVVTRGRQAGMALKQAAAKVGGRLTLPEAIKIMTQYPENQTAYYSRHMEILSFLNDAAIPAAGKRAYVHAVGSAAQLGIANWMAAHNEVTMIFHATLEETIAAIMKSLPVVPADASCPFLPLMAGYPAEAHPFIWKMIRAKD